MDRTIEDATVRHYRYDSHDRIRQHLADFVAIHDFARRPRTLRGLTPHGAICEAWTEEQSRFTHELHHQLSEPNILT